MSDTPGPSSWRDVYELVRDTRSDTLTAVAAVDAKVDVLTLRVNAMEDARILDSGKRAGREQVFGVARSSIALIVSLVSAGVALVAVFAK